MNNDSKEESVKRKCIFILVLKKRLQELIHSCGSRSRHQSSTVIVVMSLYNCSDNNAVLDALSGRVFLKLDLIQLTYC